jgi:Ca2+-transporting ATPase
MGMSATPAIRAELERQSHARDTDAVARELRTHAERGLSQTEAAIRLAAVGPNRLGTHRRPPYGTIMLRQLLDPLVALLIAAAVVSAAIGDGFEAAVISAIVVLNAVLGFTQEASAALADLS